jgi:hypothetical protein
MFGRVIIKEKDLPFIRDVHRLIKKYPEYLDGIREGRVHVAFDPGWREIMQDRRKLNAVGNGRCYINGEVRE